MEGGENMINTINNYIDLFEYHKPVETGNAKQREGYWSFKLDVIGENKLYMAISEVMRDAALDEDSKYNWTVDALESMKAILLDTDTPKGEEIAALEDYENIAQHSEAPIYTHELTAWIANNIYCLEDELNEMGWNSEDGGIDNSMRGAYTRAWENHYFAVLAVVKNSA